METEASKSIGKGLSALVVDDDNIARVIHKVLLETYGVQTQVAKNGEEAIILCRAGASFDLVLMDKEMPIMDGVHAVRELRAMGVKSMIVGVTSVGPGPEVLEFRAAGLDECLTKPINAEMVLNLVNFLAIKRA